MKRATIPIRTCIGCRQKLKQNKLIRFVCHEGASLQMQESTKLPGRGAYVCRSKSCIQETFKAPKRINTLLRVRLSGSVINEFRNSLLEKEIIADE